MTAPTEFEQAATGQSASLPREFLEFLLANKKWWLLPIVVLLLFFGLLMVFATTGAAPFIYTMF
jgi:hypothetical protein